MKRNFAVIGLGRFGSSICRTLVESGHDVLAIDSNEDKINEILNEIDVVLSQNDFLTDVFDYEIE